MATLTLKEPAGLSGGVREETSILATVDAAELDVLYRDLPSYQPEFVGDLATAKETRVVLPFTLSTELIAPPPESVGEMTMAFMMPPVLATRSQGNHQLDVSDIDCQASSF